MEPAASPGESKARLRRARRTFLRLLAFSLLLAAAVGRYLPCPSCRYVPPPSHCGSCDYTGVAHPARYLGWFSGLE